jgi:hypothetical protein
MFTDPQFESFIDLYSIGKAITFARNNVMEHIDTGAIGGWAVSMLGFVIYCVGVFTPGWFSLVVLAFGTPLIMAWAIYLSRTPSKAGQRQAVTAALTIFYNNGQMNELMSYLSSHYTFESSALSWRKGIGAFLGVLWLGYIIGVIGSRNSDMETLLSSVLLQSTVCLSLFAFLISTVLVRRLDRIVIAMKDIQKFDFRTKQLK